MVCLQMFNQIACVKQSTFLSAPPHRSSADLTLCLTPVVVIYLKMSPNRCLGSSTELLIANEMLAANFSETCTLKYFDTMTNFPNSQTLSKCNTRRQISYLLVRQRVVGQVGQQITFCVRIARPVSCSEILLSGIGAWYRQFKNEYEYFNEVSARYWYRYRCIPNFNDLFSNRVDLGTQ